MPTPSLSLSQRIRKYRFHYLLVLPALLVIFATRIVPATLDLLISLKQFSPIRGLAHSEWVGLDNFRYLLAAPEFRQAALNTVVIKFGAIALTGLVAFGLALALGALRPGFIRRGFATLFLIPFFIPSLVLAFLAFNFLSIGSPSLIPTDHPYLADSFYTRPIVILLELLKTVGIPIALAVAAMDVAHARPGLASAGYWRRRGSPAAMAVLSFMILQLAVLVASDFDIMHQLVNPLTYETGTTLELYAFRTGMIQANFSYGSAISVFQYAVQLPLIAIAYLLLRRLSQQTLFARAEPADKPAAAGSNPRGAAASIVGMAVAAIYSLVVLTVLYLLFVAPFFSPADNVVPLSTFFSLFHFGGYFFLYAFAAVVAGCLTLTLAYPLTVKDLPGRNGYRLLLLLVAAVGSGTMGQYYLVLDLELVNTFFSQVFYGFVTVAGAFVLKAIFNNRYPEARTRAEAAGWGQSRLFFQLFVPSVWKPLIGIVMLHFAALWSNASNSLLYFNTPDYYAPTARLLPFLFGRDIEMNDPALLLCAAIVSLPPIVLFLLFRKLITPETFLSQIRK